MFTRPRTLVSLAGLAVSLVAGRAAPLPSFIEVHPALELHLFAQEPQVVDPVALCFDAAGRMYVVEMRDYPYGVPPENQPGGTVRLLEDTNGDGRADRSVLFAERLSFPTAITPYRDGVIVTAPPEIVFLKDTDGDGRADVREVLYHGFRRAVTDGNMSGLRWGLDNWLHGVNGGPGGNVVSTRKRGDALRLSNLDFRLKPDTGEIETTYTTGGGFGLVFDDWGRSLTPHNVNHMQMRITPARVLARNAGLPPVAGTHSISDHGDMARIYAISEAQTRPNHPEQAGYFSAAGAVGFIGHQGYPGDLAGSVTVADMVGNLVHRDVLSPAGPVLVASRPPGEQTKEFIASTDSAFRPTTLELGPDGALYVADMQRDVIEHPDYIPAKMRETLDIRAGDDRGRIYRLLPRKGVTQNQKPLAMMTPTELVEELGSPNQWRRMTAQRLIVEHNHLIATAPLEELVKTGPDAVARVHALWTLQGLGELGESVLLVALNDADERVVENAIQVAAAFASRSPEVTSRVQSLAVQHPSVRVRFLGARAVELSTDAVLAGLRKDGEHRWSRLALLSALPGGEHLVLTEWIQLAAGAAATSDMHVAVARDLGALVGARGRAEEAGAVVNALIGQRPSLVAPVLEGLREGLGRRGGALGEPARLATALATLAQNAPLDFKRSVWRLERQLGLPVSPSQTAAIDEALRIAVAADQPASSRIPAIELLALAEPGQFTPVLLSLFSSQTPVELQRAALEVLRQPTEAGIGRGLLERWREIHPALKRGVTTLLLSRRDYHALLLDAIEEERVKLGELNLDLEDRRRLISWSSAEIKERASKLIGDGEYGNRQAKVEEWLAKLPPAGDAAKGRVVYEQVCASCHLAGTLGHDVGPNLTGLAHRSVEDLVSNILDPNMAINPNYFGVAVETKDGELLTGILTAETVEAITLLQAQGIRTSLRRDQIQRLESTGTSLMPEGLEAGMSPADLRDLVAFLQQAR
jgi:putative membrane-bound dehydrogenase-like protein